MFLSVKVFYWFTSYHITIHRCTQYTVLYVVKSRVERKTNLLYFILLKYGTMPTCITQQSIIHIRLSFA
jgi:hypothetical protein